MFNVEAKRAPSKGPRSRMCFICGRQTLIAGWDFHVAQCKDLFTKREAQKPLKERRSTPQDPMLTYGMNMTKMSTAEIDALAMKSFETTLAECRFCGRKFLPEKLAIHNRSCTESHPAKRVAGKDQQSMSPRSSSNTL